MSKKVKLGFLVVAGLILVAIGVFASFLLLQRFQASQAPTAVVEDVVKTNVVILSRDLNLGDRIQVGDVDLVSVPVEIVPRNAVTTVEEVLDKIVKTNLIQGEMLLAHNLANPTNNNRDLSFILGDDHVLMAFPAEDLMSRESMVQRGDLVDIFATFYEEIKTGDNITFTDEENEPELRPFTVDVMQKVSLTALVMDVIEMEGDPQLLQGDGNQEAASTRINIRAFLLALTPQDALVLKHLKDTGAIFDLVLRAPTSTIQFDLTPVTEEYIIEFYGLEILP